MQVLKKLIGLVASLIVIAFGLAACGDPGVSYADAQKLRELAKAEGERAEASKADAKLAAAQKELGQIGRNTAREGGFNSSANCNVTPNGVVASKATKDFPSAAVSMFREACVKEIGVMNAERRANADRAVAKAKERERKAAIAKANAEAKRKLATKPNSVKSTTAKPSDRR